MKSLISFAILTILFVSCEQPNDNTFREHQNNMETLQSMEKKANDVRIEYNVEANTVILSFPQEQPAPAGSVTFVSPTKAEDNRIFELKTDPMKRMFIRIDNFEKGEWTIKVAWQGEDKIYEKEEKIKIEPNDWARPIHK